MVGYFYSAVAGGAITAAAVVFAGGSAAGAFWIGFVLALCVTAAITRMVGARRLARFFAQWAPAAVTARTKEPASRAPAARPDALSEAERDVESALVNFGATAAQARAWRRAARAQGAPAEFEPLWRAALSHRKAAA